MKIRRIPDPVYLRDVTLVIGTDPELDRWLKKQRATYPEISTEWYGVNGRFIATPDKAGRISRFILVSTKNRGAILTVILGHEVLHLTFSVLQAAGLQLSDESDEAFTYYFQSRFAACLRHAR